MAATAPFGPAHVDPTAGRRLTQERLTNLAGSVSRPVGIPEEDALTDTNRVLELRFYWGEVLLGMYHYARPKQVTIGESRRADIFLSSEGLPQQAFPLIRYQDSTYMLRCTSNMEGEVQAEGTSLSLAEARKKFGTADASLADTYQIPMPQDMRVLLHWGGATFAMRFVPPAKLLPAPFGKNIDFGYLNVMVLSLVLHLGLIITLAIYPHDTEALKVDLFGEPDRFAQLILEAPKESKATQDLLEKIKKQVEVKQIEIKEPSRKPEAKEVVRPLDVKSPMKSMPRPPKSAEEKKAEVAKRFANLLGGAPGKAGGAGTILGGGGGSLAGSLQNVIGTAGTGSASAGMAGLGVRGSGPLTGGGLGQSRGIGGIGTSGRLGGGGAGYGAGVGLGAGKARNTIDFETPQVEGALAADVIKKVINENKNQVRYCYEVELQRNQNLEGRVLVRWIIGGTGAVIQVSIKESSLHNAAVETCLMNKIKGWKFPAPAGGGTVEVNYPFVFKAS
jgi:TonB family protein